MALSRVVINPIAYAPDLISHPAPDSYIPGSVQLIRPVRVLSLAVAHCTARPNRQPTTTTTTTTTTTLVFVVVVVAATATFTFCLIGLFYGYYSRLGRILVGLPKENRQGLLARDKLIEKFYGKRKHIY